MFLSSKIPMFVPVAAYVAWTAISMVAMPAMFDQINTTTSACSTSPYPWSASATPTRRGSPTGRCRTPTPSSPLHLRGVDRQAGRHRRQPPVSGITMASLHVSSQAMQDLKSAHMTLTSPRAMIAGQVFGVALSSVVSPCIFRAFEKAEPGAPGVRTPSTRAPTPGCTAPSASSAWEG